MNVTDILKAKDDFVYFCEEIKIISMRKDIVELCQFMSGKSKAKWIDEYACDYSLIVGVAYPLWRLGRNHQLRLILVTESPESAHRQLEFIGNLINNNETVKNIFPALSIAKHKADSLTVDRTSPVPDPSVRSIGVFSPLLGYRADVMIFDNIVPERNAPDTELLLLAQKWFKHAQCKLIIGGECVIGGNGIEIDRTKWVQYTN